MGNQVRTPRPKYFQNGVVEFYVMNKIIYFKVWLWLKDGFHQIEYTRGKYENDEQINDIISKLILTQHSSKNTEVQS